MGIFREQLFCKTHILPQASKRAAASFFFELLVLGTRDCVKLEQPERYGDISVQAKPKLFDGIAVVRASQAVNA